MMSLHSRVFLIASIASLVSGCVSTMAPRYEQAAAPIPISWPESPGISTEPGAVIRWQSLFADPRLSRIVQLALDNNRDLRMSALNIERARAQYGIQRSVQFPEVDVGISGSSGRTPASVSSTGTSNVSHIYSANLGITAYELDLFGRLRSLTDQALQQYLVTAEVRRAARTSLIAEVAGAYLNLTGDQEQLALARETLRSREGAYALQRKLHEVGSASELALHQADAEVEAARDQLLVLESKVATDRNVLELLVGTPLPAELHPEVPLESMLAVQDLPPGLPSELLQKRSDILAAEHALIAAHANIGAARAAFFPRITLIGGFGQASASLSDLFDGNNHTWSLLPQISVPIFTGGRLTANLQVAEVERNLAVLGYERSIQSAFREVADALAVRARLDGRLKAQQRQVQSVQASYMLVQQRYKAGVSSYLEVLDAQRTLYVTQQGWITTRLAKQVNLMTLYKVLGGDWPLHDIDSNVGVSLEPPVHRSNGEYFAIPSM